MATTAHLQLFRRLASIALPTETLGWRDSAVLFVAVAICCAASLFALLCKYQSSYPVAPLHEQVLALPVPPTASPNQAAQIIESRPTSSIAHTHNELLALERLGERNYIEFSIARSDGFQPVGPIELGFWRGDARHGAAQASVLLGQHRLDLRHLKVNERVLIPIGRSENLELVINHVSRNQIRGYLSEPKDNRWQFVRFIDSVVP
ncbi:MAG TPA: hypothetical protein VH302_09945 [Bryobacteraceae bacterium]|jgi:hypothetical protein|nr:hypothetical protein [Bryobacteraceae bacterium]